MKTIERKCTLREQTNSKTRILNENRLLSNEILRNNNIVYIANYIQDVLAFNST